MSNKDKLVEAFATALEIDPDSVPTADTKSVSDWDSIKQMALVVTLEDALGIELNPEDIIGLTSFENGIEIVKKYGVEI